MATATEAKTPGQLFALVFGVVYILVGLVGFAYLDEPQEIFGIFGVDMLHNIAHLGIGGLLVFGSRTPALAKTINLVVGIVYLLLAILGFASVLDEDTVLHINSADNILHIVTAVLALYFGTAGGRTGTATP
ncbi:MAG TPA: DUF4383 domain-containing protein [Actinomycetota bacterium]|nr:DUF4383 domain-containing protein [Actinomycetota bacterium]